MRIIALGTIRTFWERPANAESERALRHWYEVARLADWSKPQDVKEQFRNASILGDNRVVFNIAGNKYRLVVKFNYAWRIGYVRFIGTHAQHDSIDAETV